VNPEFRQEDPPTGTTTPLALRYADELAKVRTQPGVWFRLMTMPDGPKAHRAAGSLRRQCPDLEFRPTSAGGDHVVYVRCPA